MAKITAEFDGEDREFEIERRWVWLLEVSLGRSLNMILKDIIDGEWRYEDIVQIISFALYGPTPNERSFASLMRRTPGLGTYAQVRPCEPNPHVIDVLEREGHGNFAPLCADILADAVFNTGDESEKEPADDEAA